jgi:hypothetical protein
MPLRRPLALLVVLTIASLVVLAHATPPDPEWLGGFWDDGDYDNVVLMVTSGVGVADSYSTDAARPVEIQRGVVVLPGDDPLLTRPHLSSDTRAPPAA